MKRTTIAALALIALLPLSAIHAQGTRQGVVVALKPIPNRGEDESEVHKKGRTTGSIAAGFLAMKSAASGIAGRFGGVAAQAAPAAGGIVGGAIAGEGPATHYMVKLSLDDGKMLVLVQSGQAVQGLHTGSNVKLIGSGSQALVMAR
jgi:outer membrane lipoprotein SlyB